MGDFVDGVVGNVKALGGAVVDGVKAVGTALTGSGNSTKNYNAFGDEVNTSGSNSDEAMNAESMGIGTTTSDGGVVVQDLITGEPSLIYPEGKKDPNAKDKDKKDPKQSDGGEDGTTEETVATNSSFQDTLDADTTVADAQAIVDGAETSLTDATADISINPNAQGTTIDGTDTKFNVDTEAFNTEASQINETDVALVDAPEEGTFQSYDVATSSDQINSPTYEVDPVTGEVTSTLDSSDYEIDMEGAATGFNADGSINETGVALNNFASQGMTTVIDTSTVSGQLLAEQLGQFNYIDAKATTAGQLEILSAQFVDSNGNPKIPSWCQGIARDISRNIAFNGITGTAALAATSQALMEATLPIASEDAQFFKTLTIDNLDNKQESIINKAKVLANFETLNLNARENASVINNKNLLDQDFKNQDNAMQAEVINKSARVTALLEDTKEINVERRFAAQGTNDMAMYYDDLIVRVARDNANALNTATLTNVTEANRVKINNSNLESSREQFYQNMQYNIDLATSQWRQEVETANTKLKYDAAATDVKNDFDLSMESLNQIWDRADSILDYAWKSTETELDRENKIALAMISAKAGKGSFMGSVGNIMGAMAGTQAGATAFISAITSLSDQRLKENIVKIGSLDSGLNLYTWDWTTEAVSLGADPKMTEGVLAQEVIKTHPEAVETHDSGYYMVDYGKLQ